MLGIEKVDHVGIRVTDPAVSIAFYERLGFRTFSDTGFYQGHPIIMQHPSGVVLNLLGPGNMPNDKNILMDVEEKYPGITHVSFNVSSMGTTRRFLEEDGIPLSGQFSFKGMHAVFIRDPRPQCHRARRLRRGRAGDPQQRAVCRLRSAPVTLAVCRASALEGTRMGDYER